MEQEHTSKSLPLFKEISPVFEALKDENRQELIIQLVCYGPQSMGNLTESSHLSRTAVSHHLKILERAGIITVEKKGTTRICRHNLGETLGELRNLVNSLEEDLSLYASEDKK